MTVDDAKRIIARLAEGEARLWRSRHFLKRLEERRYSIRDAYKILRSHEIEGVPTFDEKHGNQVIRLRGRSFDGRATELVLGLQEIGPCMLVTITDRSSRRARTR